MNYKYIYSYKGWLVYTQSHDGGLVSVFMCTHEYDWKKSGSKYVKMYYSFLFEKVLISILKC